MFLENPNGSSFHLQIAGYEFPETQSGYDANWLLIRITATLLEGTWTVTDPSLLTYEVAELVSWLESFAANTHSETALGFTEPNLSFRGGERADGTRILRVSFAAECRPPWARTGSPDARDPFVEFALNEIDLHVAAESLRSQLALYPQRGSLS